MKITLNLTYLSGNNSEIMVDWDDTVGDLQSRLQVAAGQPLCALIHERGFVMQPLCKRIREFDIADGARITMVWAVRRITMVYSTQDAFALVRRNGNVVTWGQAHHGGDSSAVREQLTDICSISSTRWAFAAIKIDGSVVTWGDAHSGGNSSEVRQQLTDIMSISSTGSAFAAIKADGSVVTWGIPSYGGDSSAVFEQLRDMSMVGN